MLGLDSWRWRKGEASRTSDMHLLVLCIHFFFNLKKIEMKFLSHRINLGFPGGIVVKNLPANSGDSGLIPGLGRSPGGGNGNPLQYSCLGNPMDRGGWRDTFHGVAESDTT